MEKYVIITAGGKGHRFSTEQPKQFVEIFDRPLLMHTFDAFSETGIIDHFVLVLPAEYIRLWDELCEKHQFKTDHIIKEGGPKRYHSVKSGLMAIPENVLVAIHDAARPFVSQKIIVIAVEDSLREISGSLSKPVNRNLFKRVQTPQFFRSSLIKKAYEQPYNERFTDDATVLETSGEQIYLMEGDTENIKITHPADLAYAEYLLRIK